MSLQNQIDILALGLFNTNNKKRVDGFDIYEPILAPCVTEECEKEHSENKIIVLQATYVLPIDTSYSTTPGYVDDIKNGNTSAKAFYFTDAFLEIDLRNTTEEDQNTPKNIDDLAIKIEQYYKDPESDTIEKNIKEAFDRLLKNV
jgi:hypothetical protein